MTISADLPSMDKSVDPIAFGTLGPIEDAVCAAVNSQLVTKGEVIALLTRLLGELQTEDEEEDGLNDRASVPPPDKTTITDPIEENAVVALTAIIFRGGKVTEKQARMVAEIRVDQLVQLVKTPEDCP